MSAKTRAELLEYMAPGFLHGLCNALFKIQGQARMLDRDSSTGSVPAGPDILATCHEAAEAVEIYRIILDPEVHSEPVAAGPLLRDVATLLRGRLQEAGIQIQWDEALESLTHTVRRCDVVLPVVTAMHRLSTALPTGFEGNLTIHARWDDGLEVDLGIVPSTGCLPFEVDLAEAIRDASESFLGSAGRVAESQSGLGITIAVPTGAIA